MAAAVAVALAASGCLSAVGNALAVGFAVASLSVWRACAHFRLRKYAKCRVETLYLSEIVGAEASATSVSGTRVSIMTKATSEAVAGRVEAARPRAIAKMSPMQRDPSILFVATINPRHLLHMGLLLSTLFSQTPQTHLAPTQAQSTPLL